MFSLEILKELCGDLWMVKKAVKNITNLRTLSKEKGIKNFFPWDECKLKQVIVTQPLLTIGQIFEKAGIEGIKKNKRCRILCELGSVKKKSPIQLVTKANILKCQNWPMK